MRSFFGSVSVQGAEQTELTFNIMEERGVFGLEVISTQPGRSDSAVVLNITESRHEIDTFAQCLLENYAYPENLADYVEDYLFEKRTNELMGNVICQA